MPRSAKRLGRGLDSLVSNLRSADPKEAGQRLENDLPSASEKKVDVISRAGQALMVHVDKLVPNPKQPRSIINDEGIISLANSIRTCGVLQPIMVRPVSGRFEIIAGERRLRAAKVAELAEVPVLVREASEQQMLEFALIENIQREDLNAIDRARAYRQFCDRFDLKPEEVATRVGEDRTTVVNYLRLLELPREIAELVISEKLSMGHARCLLGVKDDDRRLQLAISTAENELSVRALEGIVRRQRTRDGEQPVPQRDRITPHIRDLQRRFEEAVKTKVTVREGRRKGAGRIVIEYYSLDDFDRIASLLGVSLD